MADHNSANNRKMSHESFANNTILNSHSLWLWDVTIFSELASQFSKFIDGLFWGWKGCSLT